MTNNNDDLEKASLVVFQEVMNFLEPAPFSPEAMEAREKLAAVMYGLGLYLSAPSVEMRQWLKGKGLPTEPNPSSGYCLQLPEDLQGITDLDDE